MRNTSMSNIRPLALLLALVVFTLPVFALDGYYTEEEVRAYVPDDRHDTSFIRKTWYAGDRMRKEEPLPGITIARFDLDIIHVLNPIRKIYNSVKSEDLRQYFSDILATMGVEDQNGKLSFPDDLYIRTDATKTIGIWHCYQVITNPKYRKPERPYTVFWYSTDVKFPSSIYGEALKELFGNAPEVDGLFDRILKFEGYPVRTESHGPGSQNTITSLLKIEQRKNIDPNLFEVPSDYKLEPLDKVTGPVRYP
jgi:hypothetical protein